MNDNEVYIRIIEVVVKALLMFLIVSIITCSLNYRYQDHLITQMVLNGNDPIEAACSLKEVGSSSNVEGACFLRNKTK